MDYEGNSIPQMDYEGNSIPQMDYEGNRLLELMECGGPNLRVDNLTVLGCPGTGNCLSMTLN